MTREQWKKMSNIEKRIKVAVPAGWTQNAYGHKWSCKRIPLCWVDSDNELPNYPCDIKAMHDLIPFMQERGVYSDFLKILMGITSGKYGQAVSGDLQPTSQDIADFYCAAADQRAEAFVLAMEKL